MLPELSQLATHQNYDQLNCWCDSFSAHERLLSGTGLQLRDPQSEENTLEIRFSTRHTLVDRMHAVGKTGHVYGTKLSPGMFAMARQRIRHTDTLGRISLHLGDATCLNIPANEFKPYCCGAYRWQTSLLGRLEN